MQLALPRSGVVENMIFRTLPFLIRMSSPSNHLLKINILHHFKFRIRPFCEKWIILIYSSSYEDFLEAGNSQNPFGGYSDQLAPLLWASRPSGGKMSIEEGMSASVSAILSAAVVALIHGEGLNFSLVQSQLLSRVIVAARNISQLYKLPTRKRSAVFIHLFN